jgi:uncharacterized membrane protein YraQ (UPF0718 family)
MALARFIITSALIGAASIVLTFTMFGPVWGVLRVALPLIAVCRFGWGLQAFWKKAAPGRWGHRRSVLLFGVWVRQRRQVAGTYAIICGRAEVSKNYARY